MYGRTLYGRLSCFIREEVPNELIHRDMPRSAFARHSQYSRQSRDEYDDNASFTELRRTPNVLSNATPKREGAKSFGIDKLPCGARVRHGIFGDGEILSARDMGGDVLYEVKFDTGEVKKLMATFAKLQRIND